MHANLAVVPMINLSSQVRLAATTATTLNKETSITMHNKQKVILVTMPNKKKTSLSTAMKKQLAAL